MKICVVGVGYVGLVTASCLAGAGNQVTCVDVDEEKIQNLNQGKIPIYEPTLEELVQHNVNRGRLTFTTSLKTGVDNSLIIFLAVGTPSSPDGSADISAVITVTRQIAELLTDYRIISTKSTVPVGTYKKVTRLMKSKTNVPFDYISNPEFLKEGAAVDDFMSPDRIIIGTTNPQVQDIMKRLYAPFMRRANRIIFMDPISAEMTKYTANSMLATRISFMNEISELCEKVGADVESVRVGIGSDSRIGRSFLFPGVGFGGSCFPKDIRALIHTGSENKIDMKITESVRRVNHYAQERFVKRILSYFEGKEDKTTLAVWGLAFKAKTDDVRESPAMFCIKKFLEKNITIKAYDPEAMDNARRELDGKIETVTNGYDALDGADALIILTEWQEFRNPDFKSITEKLNKPVIFDGRNLYDTDMMQKAGIEYHSVGRPTVEIKSDT